MNKFHAAIKWTGLIFIALTPLAYGAYPPWASGFAVAGMCTLGVAHVAVSLIRGVDYFPVDKTVRILAFSLAIWLAGLVICDVYLGTAGGRTPALSLRQLPYVFAFFAAAMWGASFSSPFEKRAMLWTFSGVGLVLALLAFAQWRGFDVKTFKASAPEWRLRPSGIFINPNRLGVMLSLCLASALALFVDLIKNERHSHRSLSRQRAEQAVLLLAIVAMGGSLSLTLSRLTLISFGLSAGVLAWLWTRASMRQHSRQENWDLPLADRVQRAVFIALPVLVLVGWLAWVLSFGGQGLNDRLRALDDGEGRFGALMAAQPLLWQSPWIGAGLGAFELAFTPIQPITLADRWHRLHWDWLQFAIEAGWPAFLIVIGLTLAWVRAWWRNLNALAERAAFSESWILLLVPVAGCATVLLCTVADFPLRETSVALVFFCLAGNLSRRITDLPPREKSRAIPPPASAPAKINLPVKLAALPLLAALCFSAFIAGRNGWAVASSPWFGQFLFPPVPGPNLNAWQRAIERDPGDPALRYFLALGANQQPKAAPEIYEQGLAQAKLAEALSPRDYLIPWTAASLAEKLDRLEESDEFNLRAIALFPQNSRLRQDHGLFFLRQFVANGEPGSFRRAEGLSKAVAEFRWLMRADPRIEEQLKNWMIGAGCQADEVCLLWEGEAPHQCVSRAKYFGEQGHWDLAARELALVKPEQLKEGEWHAVWFHTLDGILEFRKGDDAAGIARWAKALYFIPGLIGKRFAESERERKLATYFMAAQIEEMRLESVEKVAKELAVPLKDYPGFVNALALKMHYAGHNVDAEQLLRKTAGTTDYLYRTWAYVALALGDDSEASRHAYKALQFGGGNQQKWYDGFMQELEQRRKRRKEKG